MSIEISREELAGIVARSVPLSPEEIHTKIERGVLESEQGEVVDGETFSTRLLAELDEIEHKRRAE